VHREIAVWLIESVVIVHCNKNIATHKFCAILSLDLKDAGGQAGEPEGMISMSKTTSNKGPEFSAFDPSTATEQLRSFTEKTADQAKETYERMKMSAEDARKAFEASFDTVKNVSDEILLKSVAAVRAGTEANLAQVEALVAAKSFSDMMELQSSFLRKQMELALDQTREFQTLTQKAAVELTKPVKDAFEKAIKQAA
jgi:phasin